MHGGEQIDQSPFVLGARVFLQGLAERLILNATASRQLRRIRGQKCKWMFGVAAVLSQVETDPPDLMPHWSPLPEKSRQALPGRRDLTARPTIQILPNAIKDRAGQILGPLHRRDAQNHLRQFGRARRPDGRDLIARALRRVTQFGQVTSGKLAPIVQRSW